jgi:hypothetical protein
MSGISDESAAYERHRAGATAYLVAAAGLYSGATAPTTGLAGAYCGGEASAPAPAAGAFVPIAAKPSAAEVTEFAGANSLTGVSEPTRDPARALGGFWGGASPLALAATGASRASAAGAGTVEPAGGCALAGARAATTADGGPNAPRAAANSGAAEVVDPSGADSAAGANAIVDPAGAYWGAGAVIADLAGAAGDLSTGLDVVNPTGAPAGYYYQAGATAYIEDAAGTYSLAGATTPTADPAGTFSAAGASAPTTDPAGTYSSPYALDRLILDPDNDGLSPYEVLSFNSETAVTNYFGVSSEVTTLASKFFDDYGSAATLLVTRYPVAGSRAHLFGGNISNMTLAELQALNGVITITSQGYTFSGSIDLSGVTSFSAAAAAIRSALDANLPVAATATGSSIAPVSVSFTGYQEGANSTNGAALLVVTAISSGALEVGGYVSGAGIAPERIYSQVSGTPGGVGVYNLATGTGTASSETMTETYGILTVGSVSSGTVAVGEMVTDTTGDVLPYTVLEANLSGSGAGSTWIVNNDQTLSSENITITADPLNVVYTNKSWNLAYFKIQQNGNAAYNSAALSYAGGTVAASLGLTQASGAYVSSPGEIVTDPAAWMNNFTQTVTDQFGSFQTMWPQLAALAPEQQDALEAWAQSTDGQFQFLQNYTSSTPPAGASAPTTDPPGTYSGPGASAPTPADPGTYIPVAGATSAAMEIVDPAGTYSGSGASAPTAADPGTYIPIVGATSSSAEIVDLAGTYSPAGASAPTIDPLGTYSAAGATAPTLADPGAYIPVTGATSSGAEIVDPAGSYSLAGASAPTLAQPGYYVPTAGASSQTPDDPGYYTPLPGATAEIAALPPIISGTVAGQSGVSGQPETPFSSVTIADPNTDTSDSLSIQLSGAGGALADGPGFDGLTMISPYLYTLSGAATAIAAELDALTFTPGTDSGTTTFTLTDESSAGTSASDANTTVTTSDGGPVVVSVSTFLADQSTLDEIVGGFDISDTAANITANLDQLSDPNIDAITISDDKNIGPSVQQFMSYGAVIAKLQNENLSPVLLAISDTVADVLAWWSTLVADTGEIASITASDGPMEVSTATFLADQSTLDKIVGGFAISDTASDVVQNLDALSADPNAASIGLTDGGTPELTVSIEEALNDSRALGEIASPHTVDLADSAANIELISPAQACTLEAEGYTSIASTTGPVTMTVAEADDLTEDGIAVTGAPVIAWGTVATMSTLSPGEGWTLLNQGYTLAVLDTAADIRAMSNAQITALSIRDILLVEASDTNVALSAAQATNLEGANMTVRAPSGFDVTLTASAANISALSTKTIAGLPALGVSGIVSLNGSVKIDIRVAQALALEGANLGIAGPNGAGDRVLVSDTAANLESLTASQIAALPASGVTGLVSTNAGVSYTSAQTAAILSSGLSVSAAGAYTVTENFANGDYSVYESGQLIRQKSVNPDGSYDVGYFDVTGKTYSSLEDIYNAAGTLQAAAEDNANGSGSLLLSANGLTVTSSAGSESVTIGPDTFFVNPHSVETTSTAGLQNETFVYGPGFGQDTLAGFLATGASHDVLQFSASMFGFPAGQSQTADAQALLSSWASGTTNAVISDLDGDALTLNAKSIALLGSNLGDFKFT